MPSSVNRAPKRLICGCSVAVRNVRWRARGERKNRLGSLRIGVVALQAQNNWSALALGRKLGERGTTGVNSSDGCDSMQDAGPVACGLLDRKATRTLRHCDQPILDWTAIGRRSRYDLAFMSRLSAVEPGKRSYEVHQDCGHFSARISAPDCHGVRVDPQGLVYVHHTVQASSNSNHSVVVFNPRWALGLGLRGRCARLHAFG